MDKHTMDPHTSTGLEQSPNAEEPMLPTVKAKSKLSAPVLLSASAFLVASTALVLTLGSLGVPSQQTHSVQLLGSAPERSPIQLVNRSAEHSLFSSSSSIIADVAQDIAPSVVNIDIKKTANPAAAVTPFGPEFFERFFGGNMVPFQGVPQRMPVLRGNGSGVIISPDGYVLTNNHVVQGANEIIITLNDGRKFNAKVVGRDPMTDIAVLKMDGASGLRPAVMGNSSILRPGDWVIAVGSPLGFDHTVTLGIVSALSRQVPDINANVDFIQTDAAINPGNSGGPLVNLKGEIIGINTAIAGTGQNIGFAIPIDSVKKITNELITQGKITRPWIGISMAELKPDLAKSLGLPETTNGVVVAQVMPDSPSFRAGFQQGDVIQRMNGKAVRSPKEIQDFIRSQPVNATINFQILRNGQLDAVSLRTEILPDTIANPGPARGE